MRKNKVIRKWAYLPFVFSSTAILATQLTAAPSQQYPEAHQVGSANYEYVGGRTQVGGHITDDGDVSVDLSHIFSETDTSSSSVGLWAGVDLDDGDGINEGGVQLNHNWVSRDAGGNVTHVNKVFAAYDQNVGNHEKATVGYGQERENLFWEGHLSKGLSGKKRTFLPLHNGRAVSSKAYDYGVGGSVGTFLVGSNMRIRAGVDHEWGDDVAAAFNGQPEEDTAMNTTLSAGIEKFFQGIPHSISLDVAASKKDGGTEIAGFDDSDLRASLGYHYDFGGASIYQPDRLYRRVRVEIPGQSRPAKYSKQAIYKRVATYKNVPVYDKKTVKKPFKQLVKSTMELEGQTFFKINSAFLIPSAQTRLKQIAKQIRSNGYRGAIRITGNSCGLGDAVFDQRLSEQRAKVVRSFLIKQGFNADHLIARGLGKGHPKYPNTASQAFKNRRVDIEYITERKSYKTAFRTEQQTVQTGTRRVATGFKNVPAGFKNVLIDSGAPGTPRVIWKTQVIKTSPAWIKRALHNNIKHDRSVNTYFTTAGSVVNVGNVAPKAVDDVGHVACSQPVTIHVLNNDSDPDVGDLLSILNFTQAANGVVTQGENNTLIYTSNGNGCGQQDKFTYTITDGNGNDSTAKVTVNIGESTGQNNAPDAIDDFATINAGEQSVTIDVLENDTDPESDQLTISSFTSGAHGRVIQGQDGRLVYTADTGFSGSDSFTYTVADGNGGIDTATVFVTVNSTGDGVGVAPIARNDSASTQEGQAIDISVIDNDSDENNDILSIESFTQASSGVVTQDGNGILNYAPNPGFTGNDSFQYTITDGNGNTASATVTVTVNNSDSGGGGIGVAPIANDDSASTDEGQAIDISVFDNDSDENNDILSIESFTQASNGVVTQDGIGILNYAPSSGFSGSDSFQYTITDGNGNTASATVTITVNSSGGGGSVAPVARDDSATTLEGQAIDISILDNDSDENNDILSIESFTQASSGVVSQDGIGILNYAPSSGFTGSDSFEYTITDGNGNSANATVSIIVESGDSPTAIVVKNDSATTTEAQGIIIDVLSNDSSGLTITDVSSSSNAFIEVVNGKTVSYLPNNGFTGVDTFTYNVSDVHGQTAQATVNVTVESGSSTPNRPPQANEDAPATDISTPITIDVLANDTDPDGDSLQIINLTQPQQGSASIANNKILYEPNGTVGSMSITYTISDGNGHTDQTVLTIAVTDPNDGNDNFPVINNESVATSQGVSILIDVLANDTDLDGDVLVLDEVDSGANGITEKVNGMVRYTPLDGFVGTDTFFYGVHDGHGHNGSGQVTIIVTQ